MKNFSLIIGIFLFSFLTTNAQTKKEKKLRNNISMGWGLMTIPIIIYPFLHTGPIIKHSKETKLLYNIKYSHQVYTSKIATLDLGFSINQVLRNEYFITYGYPNNSEKVIVDTTKMLFSSTSYLIRNNITFYTENKNLNCFVGMGLGYRSRIIKNAIINYSDSVGNKVVYQEKNPTNKIKLGLEITAGIKYFVNPHWGFYVECGLAKSLIQLGIVGRF